MSEEKTVELTMQVPKKLMDLLEQENFFGWRRDDFFLKAVKEGISTEISTMDINEVQRLELKYGPDILTVKPQKVLASIC